MTKIVFKISQFPVISETFVTNQVISAIQSGYDVSVIVSKKNDLSNSSQSVLIKKYNLSERTYEIKNLKPKNLVVIYTKAIWLVLTKYPINYLKTFNFFKYKKTGLSGRLFYDLIALHPFIDADIFHIQFGVYAEPLVRLKKNGLIKGKLLVTFHGYDVHFIKETFHSRKTSYQDLFDFVSMFTANTKYLAGLLLHLGCSASRLEIVPMGVDINYFKTPDEKKTTGKTKLVSIGRLVKLKGHELGIKAVAELVRKGYQIHYEIIGDGEERKNLELLIKKLGLQKEIALNGIKDHEYIRSALQQADLYLMTSTYDESGRREAQGLVTVEAQACGLPVCAFNSGGVPYTMLDGETGFLSEENDYMDMAHNVEKLIKDIGLRKKMSARARKFVVENYSLELSSGKMNKLYKLLLSGS